MKNLSRPEIVLLVAVLALVLLAVLAPALAQSAHYHHFADRRSWLGIPYAGDVLSNLPFALVGLLGLRALGRVPARAQALARTPRQLAALFFAGLVLTALASAWYHQQPDNPGLAVDRLGMSVAFAGLLGLGAASHVSHRAGLVLAGALLALGPLSIGVWLFTGNVLPWATLQTGGMLLMLALLFVPRAAGAPTVRWGFIIALYGLAKIVEWADHDIFALTGGLLSGHSLKHVLAALAAWPVLAALAPLVQNGSERPGRHRAA